MSPPPVRGGIISESAIVDRLEQADVDLYVWRSRALAELRACVAQARARAEAMGRLEDALRRKG